MHAVSNILITLALPLIAGALAFAVTQAAKRLWAQLDAQRPEVKQAVALAWSFVFTALAKAVDAPLCPDGATFCEPPQLIWQTVITWAVAMAMHGARKRRG